MAFCMSSLFKCFPDWFSSTEADFLAAGSPFDLKGMEFDKEFVIFIPANNYYILIISILSTDWQVPLADMIFWRTFKWVQI